MANGYSIGMTGGVMPNPMGVVGNTRSVTSTMGMTGGVMPAPLAPFLGNLPQSNSPVIVVSESTPNLMEIQNFPVVSRNGIFHIHQDPRTGQRYSMTDEFHMRIPEILSSRQNMPSSLLDDPLLISSQKFSDFFDESFYSEQRRTNTFSKPVKTDSQTKFVKPSVQIAQDQPIRVGGFDFGSTGTTGGIMPNQLVNENSQQVLNETPSVNINNVINQTMGRNINMVNPQVNESMNYFSSPQVGVSITPINSYVPTNNSAIQQTQPSRVNYQINTYYR